MSEIPFVQAANYTPGRVEPVRAVVVHTAECGESAGAAEAHLGWGASGAAGSWHYAVDCDSVTQSVREWDTAWHARGGNDGTIGVEHAGRASQSAAEWADDFSVRMLRDVSAPLVADVCRRYGIPPVRLSAAEFGAGKSGLLGHADVTVWARSQGDGRASHWDPGPSFPWGAYLGWVRVLLEPPVDWAPIVRLAEVKVRCVEDPLQFGDCGDDVRVVVSLLRRLGYRPRLRRGRCFGFRVRLSVRRFQRSVGLRRTGRVDGVTFEALLQAVAGRG